MNRSNLCLVALLLCALFAASCGTSPPSAPVYDGGSGDSDADSDSDSDADSDSDSDADSDSDSDSDTDTDTDADTDSDTDLSTACELASQADSAVICCPNPVPADCDNSSWSWSPVSDDPQYYGCCTADLSHTIWCSWDNGGWQYIDEDCDDSCGHPGTEDYVDCTESGTDCDGAHMVASFPHTWIGDWNDFGNAFTPSDTSCGSGGNDGWAQIQVPPGATLTIQENTGGSVNLRRVSGCSASSCLDYDDGNPETLTYTNSGSSAQIVYLVVSQQSGGGFEIDFSI